MSSSTLGQERKPKMQEEREERACLQPTVQAKLHPTETMLATVWMGKRDIQVKRVPRPMITDPFDVIVQITSLSVCGSDLHLYHDEIPGMQSGDIIGHEGMGIIVEVGDRVKQLKKGQRVVCAFNIACGQCFYCKKKQFTACDNTNPSKTMESMYGSKTAGLFGYTHLTGGFQGCQAEYVRIPFADNNCLPIPDQLSDEQVLFLSDAGLTGYHACVLGEVSQGQTVAIWGAGPIGLFAAYWAIHGFKASKVLLIDRVQSRLHFALEKLGDRVFILNYDNHDVIQSVQTIFPSGPDVCIDATGFRYTKTTLQKIEKALRLETDSCDALTEVITCARKFGHVSIIADYVGFANQFPIGAVMMKGLTLRGSQAPVQKYWKAVLEKIEKREVDLSFIISHRFHFKQIAQVYRMFDLKEEGVVKVILKTDAGLARDSNITQGVKEAGEGLKGLKVEE